MMITGIVIGIVGTIFCQYLLFKILMDDEIKNRENDEIYRQNTTNK